MDAPGGDFHDEEDIETPEEDGLYVHEVAGEQRVGLGAEEGAPGLLGCALRCGRQAGAAQDAPDGGGGDPMTEPSQFALDSDVTPGGVLSRQALDERDCLFRQWRPALAWLVPVAISRSLDGGDRSAVCPG